MGEGTYASLQYRMLEPGERICLSQTGLPHRQLPCCSGGGVEVRYTRTAETKPCPRRRRRGVMPDSPRGSGCWDSLRCGSPRLWQQRDGKNCSRRGARERVSAAPCAARGGSSWQRAAGGEAPVMRDYAEDGVAVTGEAAVRGDRDWVIGGYGEVGWDKEASVGRDSGQSTSNER